MIGPKSGGNGYLANKDWVMGEQSDDFPTKGRSSSADTQNCGPCDPDTAGRLKVQGSEKLVLPATRQEVIFGYSVI